MVELWVWIGEKTGELANSFDTGDIIKVQPPTWHKYFPLYDNTVVLRVRKIAWDHINKRMFTEPLRFDNGAIKYRRRYKINLEELKKRRKKPNKNGLIKVLDLNGLLLDKALP